jgi:RNA polymerase sigma-70 factor (ECF subfamily)
MTGALAGRFLTARSGEVGADPDGERALELAISSLVTAARAEFSLVTEDAVLVDRIAVTAELPDGAVRDLATAVSGLDREIVLAAACLAGDGAALDVLEHTYGRPLRVLVASIAGDQASDVLQDVWARLLVSRDGRLGRLADYGGRGSLMTWLRVVCAREAISIVRRRRSVALDDDALVGRLVTSHDPEVAVIHAQSSAILKRAFEHAVATLEVRERNLLRQHLLDGLTIDDLARLYRVHRATAARWLAKARDGLWAVVQRRLRDELALAPQDLDSLLRTVHDWIDLSLERVLATTHG